MKTFRSKGGLGCRALVVILSAFPALVVAYEDGEHQDIGTQARNNYINYVTANPDTAVGDTALRYAPYWDQVYFGLTDEDSGAKPLNHFWDPDGGDNAGLAGFDSAFTTATARWNACLENYRNGNYEQAYYYLGCVLHLSADMGVPAHVNLDAHPSDEWYEGTYIAANRVTSTAIDTTSGTLRAIMVTAAEIADNFDSGPTNGGPRGGTPDYGEDGEVDAGARRTGGFTLTPIDEGAPIAAACYPAAIAADGAILKLFFDTIKPGVSLIAPSNGDVCSGIKGVQFAALARSYNEPYNVVGRLHFVTYYYSTQDPYVPGYPGSFTWAEDCFSPTKAPNGDLQWMATWTCNLNSAKVWVKAVAYDKGLCRSLPSYTWIKIDSTRPAVINTRP